MSAVKVYASLDAVLEVYRGWESEGTVYEFACAICQTAAHLLQGVMGIDAYEKLTHEKFAVKAFDMLKEKKVLTHCLTDRLRQQVIRYHARGYSTTEGVYALLFEDQMKDVTPFWSFKFENVCGAQNISDFLVSRMSYLKPTHPRWPHKKFGGYWQTERAAYVETLKDIVLTHPTEQVKELTEHYTDLKGLYQRSKSIVDKVRLHECMMRTLAALHVLTRDPSVKSVSDGLLVEKQQALPKPTDEGILDVPVVPANVPVEIK